MSREKFSFLVYTYDKEAERKRFDSALDMEDAEACRPEGSIRKVSGTPDEVDRALDNIYARLENADENLEIYDVESSEHEPPQAETASFEALVRDQSEEEVEEAIEHLIDTGRKVERTGERQYTKHTKNYGWTHVNYGLEEKMPGTLVNLSVTGRLSPEEVADRYLENLEGGLSDVELFDQSWV